MLASGQLHGFNGGHHNLSVPTSLGSAVGASGASSVAMTTGAAIPAGATIFVGVTVGKVTTISVSSISDGINTYLLARTAGWDATGANVVELWYCPNCVGVPSGTTITATFSSTSVGGSNVPVIAAAYAEGLTSSPLDKVNSTNYEPGTAFSSGSSGTLSQATELIIGCTGFYNAAATYTEGTGFTQIVDLDQGSGNRWRIHLAYQIVQATTAINYQPSLSANNFGGSIIATFAAR